VVGAVFERLPEAPRRALREYKSQSYSFFAIAQDPDRKLSAKDFARFEALDAAFQHAPGLPSPLWVWRGFTRYVGLDGKQPWSPPSVGSVAPFPGWTSVSLSEQAAATEAYSAATNRGPCDYSVLMELELPVGQRHIYAEVAKDTATHEAELLLPRGVSYEVLSFEQLTAFRTLQDSRPGPFAYRVVARVRPPQSA